MAFGKAAELSRFGQFRFGRALTERGIARHYSDTDIAEDLAKKTRRPSSGGWRVSRQAVCGASRPADRGRMSTANSEQRMASCEYASDSSSSHSPLATRRITRTRPLASTSLPPWPRLAPAPGRRPAERMPPQAGASRQGEGAERVWMRAISGLIASLTLDLLPQTVTSV
jgi:hypothetical protein